MGGKNIIKMDDLKQCFENMGFTNVKTYIQSGNVIFNSHQENKDLLTPMIETKLSERFAYNSKIALFTQQEMETILEEAPENFGKETSVYKYDVVFLKHSLIPENVIQKVKIRKDVDFVAFGKYALYFSRIIEKVSQSYLSKIILLPEYKAMTIRNWNTTQKLFFILKEM